MFCSIYYRFARVSYYKFVRCLRDLIVIPTIRRVRVMRSSYFFLSQIIFVLSQKLLIVPIKYNLGHVERNWEHKFAKNRQDFIFCIFKSNHIREFISTSKFYLSKPFIREIRFLLIDLFFRVLFSLFRSMKRFSFVYFLLFSGLQTMGTMKASWIL